MLQNQGQEVGEAQLHGLGPVNLKFQYDVHCGFLHEF